MKCLVVVAHPVAASFVSTLAAAAIEAAQHNGHDVSVQDLYQDGFQPALTFSERQSYYSGFNRSALANEIEKLEEADILILVFPTWWFGFPAILKGWFDRVWAPEAAFDHATDLGAIKPKLHNLKRTIAVTTLGSSWWVDWLIMRRPVRRVLRTAILGTCAPKCRLDFLSFYKTEKLSADAVATAIARVKAVISTF
jgi:NAD(P)H dehydrogenase (quinone)